MVSLYFAAKAFFPEHVRKFCSFYGLAFITTCMISFCFSIVFCGRFFSKYTIYNG